jgi:Spy/CpxP family protein refolding chaperone
LPERVLSAEQRESLRAAMESQRDQLRGLQEKLRAARQALLRASLAEKFDEDAVRAKAMDVGRLDAELTVLRAKAMSEVQPPLSEEQAERIFNPPPREKGGPPGGPVPGPRRNNRPPPGPRNQPVAPKPEEQ